MILRLALAPLAFCATTSPAQKTAGQQPANTIPDQVITSTDGATLYKTYCANCHGADGKGAGPMANWLKIKAPDLTRLSIRAGGTFPLARVQRIISGEEEITDGHGAREMPLWGPVFSHVGRDQDLGPLRVYNLARFLKTMQRK